MLAALGLLAVVLAVTDTPLPSRDPRTRRTSPGMTARRSHERLRSVCAGDRPPLPEALFYELRAGAFPGSGRPDVAVHVPPGFDASRRPGALIYFHGWNGCVTTALGDDDAPCSDGGDVRPAAGLAAQLDDARANALLVAVELRADMATGEPGQMAMPSGLRDLLGELFREHLAEPLGCTLEVDGLDRVVLVTHSGGYQAAAGVLQYGDVPQITEVDLLDSLYGAQEVFSEWMQDEMARFDPRVDASLRFVDLYTLGGGTFDRSRVMASFAKGAASDAGLPDLVYDDDGDDDLGEDALAHAIVFKRVPREHPDLPRVYLRPLIESAGFARRD
jgi:hypothetical protein